PRRLGAVELAQRAVLELPALRGAYKLPAVRRHAMHAKAFAATVVGHVDRIALRLRHQDLQIGRDDRGVAVDRDVREPGEMRKPAGDGRLGLGTLHLFGEGVAPARARERLAAVEHAVLDPAGGDVLTAAGIGAGRMAGDQVVDFEPVFDGADAVFERAGHMSLPVSIHRCRPRERGDPRTPSRDYGSPPSRGRQLCVSHRFGITSPMAPRSCAEKNSRPSGMAMMARAPQFAPGISYSPITLPSGDMRPILLAKFSVNQRSPSGATVTPRSEAFGVFTGHSVMPPCASMRPSPFALVCTNQMLPSGCVTMARGSEFGVGILYSVTSPAIEMRPIWPASYSENQMSPSRTTGESGRQPGVRPLENSVTS